MIQDKPKSSLSELLLHVQNIPEPLCRAWTDTKRITFDEGVLDKWKVELVGKTQALSLSIVGKERLLRKHVQEEMMKKAKTAYDIQHMGDDYAFPEVQEELSQKWIKVNIALKIFSEAFSSNGQKEKDKK